MSNICIYSTHGIPSQIFGGWYEVQLGNRVHFTGSRGFQNLLVRLRLNTLGPMGKVSNWMLTKEEEVFHRVYFQDEADAVAAKMILDEMVR